MAVKIKGITEDVYKRQHHDFERKKKSIPREGLKFNENGELIREDTPPIEQP